MENSDKKSILSKFISIFVSVFPWREVLTFVITAVFMVLALVAVAEIPKENIKGKLTESAEYLKDKNLEMQIDGVSCSYVHSYADAMLLDIAYYYDSNRPLASIMKAEYYRNQDKSLNESFVEAIKLDKEPNNEYIRYWHGSNVIVRTLHKWFSIKSLYVINAVLLTVLFVGLTVFFIKKRYFAPAVGLPAGLIAVSIWFVPMTLESAWNFLLLAPFSLCAVLTAGKDKDKRFGVLFLCFGMLTNYLDFLSTETITLTVPLLLVLYIENKKENDFSVMFKTSVKASVSGGVGYAGAWVMKWIIASVVLGENVMPYVTEHITERIGGDNSMIAAGPIMVFFDTLTRNIGCLFPFNYGAAGAMIGTVIFILCAYMIFVYRGKNCNKRLIILYAVVGCIPYLRYLVLHNHAYLHYFFTYRAQLSTVLAVALIMDELKIWGTFRRTRLHEKRHQKRA